MYNEVKNKIIVVTAAARGIGYKIAEHFIINEAKIVVLLDINAELGNLAVSTLNRTYGNNKGVFLQCDVTKDLDAVFQKIIDQYKQIDVLVNNAGIFNDKAVKMTIDTNVTAVIEWTLKFWEHMRKDKGGKGGTIINMGSIFGFRVNHFTSIYLAAKFAVFGFTKSLGHENNYEKTGVRICAICPGLTETNMSATENLKLWNDSLDEQFKEAINQCETQKPDVVGKAVVEVVKRTGSGTAWLIEGGKPIEEIILSTNCDQPLT